MSHSAKQHAKKEYARKEALHHHHNSSVMHNRDGKDHEDHKHSDLMHEAGESKAEENLEHGMKIKY